MTGIISAAGVQGDLVSGSLGALRRFTDNVPPPPLDSQLFYNLKPANWYKVFPFYFEIKDSSKSAAEQTQLRFFLPIPPQNMTVQDLSTSEAHATIGGVVEETSAGVFNLITMTGTTGLSPEATGMGPKAEELKVSFRKYIDDITGRANPLTKLIGAGVDFVNNSISGITGEQEGNLPYWSSGSAVRSTNIESGNRQQVTTLINPSSNDDTGKLNGLANIKARVGSALEALAAGEQDPDRYNSVYANGFTWSHALRQTFLVYQREKGKNPHLQLYFTDVKANTTYRCVVRSAQFNQNAQNPFTINYNMSLKCWSVGNVDRDLADSAIDRFGPGGDLAEVFTASVPGALTSIGNTLNSFNRIDSIAGAMPRTAAAGLL